MPSSRKMEKRGMVVRRYCKFELLSPSIPWGIFILRRREKGGRSMLSRAVPRGSLSLGVIVLAGVDLLPLGILSP
jgi:hypothetical protein